MQELVNEASDTIIKYLNMTTEFVSEQAPLLAQEIIRYGIVSNALFLLSTIIGILVFSILSYRFNMHKDAWPKTAYGHDIGPQGIIGLITGVITCIFILIFLIDGIGHMLPDLIKAIFTPRLYLLEEIGKLI